MYLSRLTLDARNRGVRRDLADCQQLHRTVLGAFPQAPAGAAARGHFGILHRVDIAPRSGTVALLVQSRVAPDWSHLPAGYRLFEAAPDADVKDIATAYAGIVSDQLLRFRLRANATSKSGSVSKEEREAGARGHGQRVPVREAGLSAWLQRKGAAGGFRVPPVGETASSGGPAVRVTREASAYGRRPTGAEGGRLSFAPVVFDGCLLVTDAEVFRRTLAEGVGPAKAYGFGLLSVGPMS
jgi:CRISPR system Cascade subunit CasE